jgi:hypothetical protein
MWGIEIEMSVPMSPDQVLDKRHGIKAPISKKDGVVFQIRGILAKSELKIECRKQQQYMYS